jgi:ribosome maturation factor RimP
LVTERTWQAVEAGVSTLGFELVDCEQTPGGILRVFIDVPTGERLIDINDCEQVSHQLVHQLPVEGVDFDRLEVSSPGMDRRLTKPAHFERFMGCQVKLKLKRPLNNRRNYEGRLASLDSPPSPDAAPAYRLVLEEKADGESVLDFELSDLEQARLVPEFSFKEKRR